MGGAYCTRTLYTSPGTIFPLTVGLGGSPNNPGGETYFNANSSTGSTNVRAGGGIAGDDGSTGGTLNYPTAGGNKVANRAFMNFMENKIGRGY